MAKRIARYLKEMKLLELCVNITSQPGNPINIEIWSEADFAADKSDRKSVSGCVRTLGGAAVSWAGKKHNGVSLSTIEDEFIDALHAGRELLGLRGLFGWLYMIVC